MPSHVVLSKGLTCDSLSLCLLLNHIYFYSTFQSPVYNLRQYVGRVRDRNNGGEKEMFHFFQDWFWSWTAVLCYCYVCLYVCVGVVLFLVISGGLKAFL